MADLDQKLVFRVAGQLFAGVTNLSAANYGGTALGIFERGEMVVAEEAMDILSEATGKRVGKLVGTTLISFEFDMLQFDLDALGLPWFGNATVIREPSTTSSVSHPGLQVLRGPALFAPYDPSHPALLIYAPTYRNGQKRVPHGLDEKRTERIIVDACDDANGHTWACGLISNLSLT